MTAGNNFGTLVTALTGNETVQVLGQDGNSNNAATNLTTNTKSIAALAASGSTSLVNTALNTVGNGTIMAAGIFGKVTTRGGAQSGSAFTDTTDTAANIIAQLSTGAPVGTAFQYTYYNNTNAVATISGGTGVTVSGVTVIPSRSWARYIVTYSAAGTVTMVGFEAGAVPAIGTFTLAGTATVSVSNTAVTVNSQIDMTVATPGGTVGAIPAVKTTIAGNGFTVSGTAGDTSVYNYAIFY